nr:MAG TPA: hypothetical protein [Caudoviricetes sp.]
MLIDIAYLLRCILRLLAADRYLRFVGSFLDARFCLCFALRLDGHFLRLRLTATKKQHSDNDSEDTEDNSTDDAAVSVHPCFHLFHSITSVNDIAVVVTASNELPICILPHHAAEVIIARVWSRIIALHPLRIPDGTAEVTPVNEIIEPRLRRIDAAIQADMIQELTADTRCVLAREVEAVTSFVAVCIFHVVEYWQFQQYACIRNSRAAIHCFLHGLLWRQRIAIMIRAALKASFMSAVDVLKEFIVAAIETVGRTDNDKITAAFAHVLPINRAVVLRNINTISHRTVPFLSAPFTALATLLM